VWEDAIWQVLFFRRTPLLERDAADDASLSRMGSVVSRWTVSSLDVPHMLTVHTRVFCLVGLPAANMEVTYKALVCDSRPCSVEPGGGRSASHHGSLSYHTHHAFLFKCLGATNAVAVICSA
jgi:hypothetical protein